MGYYELERQIRKIKRVVCCLQEANANSAFDAIISSTLTTVDTTPVDGLSYTTTQDGAYSFQFRVVGHGEGGEAAYFNIAALAVKEEGVLSIVNSVQMFTPMQTGNMGLTDVSVLADGDNVIVQVMGADTVVDWKVNATIVNAY